MYTSKNFKTKKQLKEAVGLGSPVTNGTDCVEGPWYPEPHRWYATVTVENSVITKVR